MDASSEHMFLQSRAELPLYSHQWRGGNAEEGTALHSGHSPEPGQLTHNLGKTSSESHSWLQGMLGNVVFMVKVGVGVGSTKTPGCYDHRERGEWLSACASHQPGLRSHSTQTRLTHPSVRVLSQPQGMRRQGPWNLRGWEDRDAGKQQNAETNRRIIRTRAEVGFHASRLERAGFPLQLRTNPKQLRGRKTA